MKFRDVFREAGSFDSAGSKRSYLRPSLGCLLVILCWTGLARAEDKPVLKLNVPSTTLHLNGAHCPPLKCGFSALFAPAITRDNVAAIAVTNLSATTVELTGHFQPTNGLALQEGPSFIILQGPGGEFTGKKSTAQRELKPGETIPLKVALASQHLSAGLYVGEIQLRAAAKGADIKTVPPITQSVPVELRVRASAVWALLIVLVGILSGRIAQLVYDPKMLGRVQLFDWLQELESKIARISDATKRTSLEARAAVLREKLYGRNADPASLQADFQSLETDVNAALGGVAVPAMTAASPPRSNGQVTGPLRAFGRGVLGGLGCALRVLAGVSPLPLVPVYEWLLPVLVLLTLGFLVIVFMVQQYGGSGTSETFGANGLADYAALFLAGVASEAIAGGLRAVKFR